MAFCACKYQQFQGTSYKMKLYLLILCIVNMFVKEAQCKSKPLSCMSYFEQLEDDSTLSISSENLMIEQKINIVPTQAVSVNRRCERDYTFCFALWRRTENGSRIEKQGCWKESNDRNATCSQTNCTSSAPTTPKTTLYYCCCSGDLCNQNVAIVEPGPMHMQDTYAATTMQSYDDVYLQDNTFDGFIIGILVLCFIFLVLALISCNSLWPAKPAADTTLLEVAGPGYSSNLRNVDNLSLICMLDKGKYGIVMKGLLNDQEVAVKIFSEQNHDYYINERNIYTLDLMENPSILTYYGYDERLTLEDKREYQLVLSLAPHGCLQDYLIENELSWEVFCGMITSITRGLSHLHTDLRHGELHKPCVVHRDFNTRNILVKQDLTCCIADFGFAIKVRGSRYEYKGESYLAPAKSINEVGTLRYMAPELLDGAVNLRDCETSLKSVDVYALGLVLWEVATRCKPLYQKGFEVPTYMAPFQQEIGQHPTFDQMQTLVVRHKARPLFPAAWSTTPACKFLRDTCEDCWDHDAEARLTSMCTEVRMHEVASMCPSDPAASPLLNTNNNLNTNVDKNTNYVSMAEIKRMLDNKEASSSSKHSRIRNDRTFVVPPNRQLYPNVIVMNGELQPQNRMLEKNEQQQHHQKVMQVQPYQGRNPCQERNLAPIVGKQCAIFVERSKKHSFQQSAFRENSLSCLEHDVAVEELFSNTDAAKKVQAAAAWTSMGEGFPKQQNFERNLLGWHSVRALIQKKLFRTDAVPKNYEEKSNLVQPRQLATILAQNNSMQVDDSEHNDESILMDSARLQPTRPSQLDVNHKNDKCAPLRSAASYTGTPAHVQLVTRSQSIDIELQPSLTELITNSGITNEQLDDDDSEISADAFSAKFRRQRSFDVFREVFGGSETNSLDKLRHVSQRVKTPGDVPFAVRKKRADKALSLYDDRMMDSSAFNQI